VRWDVRKNPDVELQWDHTAVGAASSGRFNVQDAFQSGSTITILGAAVDFVF